MERTLTIIRKGKDENFTTPYTDREALDRLEVQLRDGIVNSPFAADMAWKATSGNATPNQWAWVHRIVIDHEAKLAAEALKAQGVAPANPVLNFKPVADLFAGAGGKLKRPTITVKAGEQIIRLKRAGEASRYPGAIHITDGRPFGENLHFGRIDPDGTFTRGRDCNEKVEKVLAFLVKDPVNFAATYGKRTGFCCFCNRPLTDDREGHSVEVGYGPRCAEVWHMPWGVKTARPEEKAAGCADHHGTRRPRVPLNPEPVQPSQTPAAPAEAPKTQPKVRKRLTAESEARIDNLAGPAAKAVADGLAQAFGVEGALQSVREILLSGGPPEKWNPVAADLESRMLKVEVKPAARPAPVSLEFVVPAFEPVEKLKFVGGTPEVRKLVNLSANAC